MDAALTDDEFAPGTPPPQKAWEDEVVGKCAEGGDIGGGGEVGGAMGDASSGEEALLAGRKRGCFALDAEAEEAKRKKRKINANRCANAGVAKLRRHLSSIGVMPFFVERFWEIEWEHLRSYICDWICKLEGAKKKALSPRAANSRFNGLNRRLTDAAKLNLRAVEPFASDCATALGNKMRALQSDGAIPGQRARLTRRGYEHLRSHARDKDDPQRHFYRDFYLRFPSSAIEGGKGCGGWGGRAFRGRRAARLGGASAQRHVGKGAKWRVVELLI